MDVNKLLFVQVHTGRGLRSFWGLKGDSGSRNDLG